MIIQKQFHRSFCETSANFNCENKHEKENDVQPVSLASPSMSVVDDWYVIFVLSSSTLLVWSACKSYVADWPVVHLTDGAPSHVFGPTATARMRPTWRPSTATRSPGGTYLSGNERREAHHVQTWMRSYPRDPTDPPIFPPTTRAVENTKNSFFSS
jgi:hypothetical protein